MIFNITDIVFEQSGEAQPIPFELLLLADPSRDLIAEYLPLSELYIARLDNDLVGVVVLLPLDGNTIEIKNIAVNPEFQGLGIGSFMIRNVTKIASIKKAHTLLIGTADSSLPQLHLYQKLGFEISEIKEDFFEKNYQEHIYENGIQARHMIMLSKQLKSTML